MFLDLVKWISCNFY